MNKKYRNITISVQNKKRFSKILGQLQMVAGKPVFANEGFGKLLDLYEQVDAEILKVVPQ